jgi:hypothetical protein
VLIDRGISMMPKALATAFCVLALGWSASVVVVSEDFDQLMDLKDALLRSGSYPAAQLQSVYDQLQHEADFRCEGDVQVALLIVQLKLSQEALAAGLADEFDRRMSDADNRAQEALTCAPSLSYVWLLGYWTRVMQGRLDDTGIRMLGMSYDTAPIEGWIASRRNGAAIRVVALAPSTLRQQIFHEFGLLVRDGYAKEAAGSYMAAPDAIRADLETEVARVAPRSRSQFEAALAEKRAAASPRKPARPALR